MVTPTRALEGLSLNCRTPVNDKSFEWSIYDDFMASFRPVFGQSWTSSEVENAWERFYQIYISIELYTYPVEVQDWLGPAENALIKDTRIGLGATRID